jgi:hypothetical protein
MGCHADHDWVWQDEIDGYDYWRCGHCTATDKTPLEREDDFDTRIIRDEE